MQPLAAVLRKAEFVAHDALGGCGAKQDDNVRPGDADFRIQPGTAGANLDGVGLLMDAALAPRLPFEVLDDVSHVDFIAVNSGSGQSLIQNSTCRSDKGASREIFFVPGLLAHQHDARMSAALAEDGLGSTLP